MPSAALSRLLPEPWVFFLDRSLGSRLVADALRAEGDTVEAHDAHHEIKLVEEEPQG